MKTCTSSPLPLLLSVLVSCCIAPGDCQCEVVINELNSDDIGRGEFMEYIELKSVCRGSQKPSLRDYILLVLTEYDATLRTPAIVFSADLCHEKFDAASDFFVVGSPNRDFQNKINLAFNAPPVMFYRKAQIAGQTRLSKFFKKPDAPTPLTDVIGNRNHAPMAVVLLKQGESTGDSDSIRQLLLTQRDPVQKRMKVVPHVTITERLAGLIKANLVDILIYSRRSIFNRCSFFEKLYSIPVDSSDYEIRLHPREWDRLGHEDLSINRCELTEAERTKPFIFSRWKLGKRTPGDPNDCSGTDWLVERNLPDILEQQGIDITQLPPTSAPRINVPEQCTSSTFVAAMSSLRSENVAENRDAAVRQTRVESSQAGSCPESTTRDTKMAALDAACDKVRDVALTMEAILKNAAKNDDAPQEKRRCLASASAGGKAQDAARPPWEDNSHFSSAYVRHVTEHQSDYVRAQWLSPSRKTWMKYLFNAEDPKKSKFQCRFCSAYVTRHGITQNVPDLANPAGYFVQNFNTMKEKIMRHDKHATHLKAIEELKHTYAKTMETCVDNMLKQEAARLSEQEKVTSRMVRTVYAEVRANIPLESHSTMVQMQKLNGLDMGVHHYERTSATRMVKVIYQTMQESFVTHVKETNYPLAMAVDTTTDRNLINFLSVYIRTLENDIPRIYLYSVIHVQCEKLYELKNEIMTLIDRDALRDVFKQRLMGFASDGASVMLGRTGGLAQKLNNEVDNNLYKIHCAAHKLQLAIGHCFHYNDVSVLRNLETFANSLYIFFNRNAVKRKTSLRNTAEALDETFYELNYIFKVRWVASEYRALERISKMLKVLLADFENIEASPDFANDTETRSQAVSLKEKLLNIKFVSVLHFTMDLLRLLADESERLQNRDGTVIGMEDYRKELRQSVEARRTSDGAAITEFLSKYKCFKDVGRLVRCQVSDLDTKTFVITDQFSMTAHSGESRRQTYPTLSSVRNKIIDHLLNELEKYFPEGEMSMFDALVPKKLPQSSSEVLAFPPKIVPVATRFGIEPQIASNEFSSLLFSLIDDHITELCAHSRDSTAAAFWSHFLQSSTVLWGDNIRKLIQIVLVLPVSTADVERGFSILAHTKYDRRSKLSPENLRNIMFLRVNGPPTESFDAVRYAKAWIKAGGMRTDDPSRQRSIRKNKLTASNLF